MHPDVVISGDAKETIRNALVALSQIFPESVQALFNDVLDPKILNELNKETLKSKVKELIKTIDTYLVNKIPNEKNIDNFLQEIGIAPNKPSEAPKVVAETKSAERPIFEWEGETEADRETISRKMTLLFDRNKKTQVQSPSSQSDVIKPNKPIRPV